LRPMEKNSTSSRSTTTTWYDTRFPIITINSAPTFNRSHSTEPSCEPTAVQRQTRCTHTFAGSSGILWTEKSPQFLVLNSSPRSPLLASTEVRISIERRQHIVSLYPNCANRHPRKSIPSRIPNCTRFIRQTANLFQQRLIRTTSNRLFDSNRTGRHTFFLLLGFLSRDIHYSRGFTSKGFFTGACLGGLWEFRSLRSEAIPI
jgi:hypothetical protein